MQVAIVNEAMAKHFWPNEEALGKRFHFFGDTGFAEDCRRCRQYRGEPDRRGPATRRLLAHDAGLFAVCDPASSHHRRTRSVIATVRSDVQSLDANLAITNVQTIREIMSQALWAPRMGAALLTLFGGLALILAAVGVYGVLSYSVNQQRQEIGIRRALGAQEGDVLRLVVGQGLRLTVVGLVVGLVLAALFARMLASLLFGVSSIDPWTFLGVTTSSRWLP